jgi:hypothetical protein
MAVAPPKSLVHPIAVNSVTAWMTIKISSLIAQEVPLPLIELFKAAGQTLPKQVPFRVDEEVVIDLLSLTLDYGMNEIPNASVSTAVGFNMRNPQLVSEIHRLTDKIKLFLQASIWVQVKRTYQSGNDFYTNQWPEGPFRVFDGYIIGSSYRKTSQNIEFVLNLTHWLCNLNFSSVLSRTSSPVNPGQISFDPSLPDVENAGATTPSGFRHSAYMTQLIKLINEQTVTNDLWANNKTVPPIKIPANVTDLTTNIFVEGSEGIKGWFADLCKMDRINWLQFQSGLCGGGLPIPHHSKNVEAASALRRFEPFKTGYQDGVPIAIQQMPGSANIAKQIATALSYQLPMALANHTLWDKLIGEFSPEYLFAIIPQVEKALVVPFNPGYRTPWTTIYSDEYEFFESGHNVPRPLRGIGLFIGREFASGGGVSLNKAPTYDTVGAYYENQNRLKGMVVFKKAPRWLSTVILPHLWPSMAQPVVITTGISSLQDALNNAINTIDKALNAAPKKKLDQAKTIWCQYARALYMQEVLRGRTNRLSGRLRFDIAPGSIIRVEEPDEPFVAQRMNKPRSFVYGQAIRVSIVINAEANQASTAIQLAFTRDEAENKDDSFSNDSHPLWKNSWSGAPLVNYKEFYYGTLKDV